MKAVRLVVFLMFVLLVSDRQFFAQAEQDGVAVSSDESAMTDEATENEIKTVAETVINEAGNAFESMDEKLMEEAPAETTAERSGDAPEAEATAAPLDEVIVNAVKGDISERRKASGKLDIFDSNINKVRTLDLIDFKNGVKQEEDKEVVQANFRDTSSGDVVTMNITLQKVNSEYKVKDMVIAEVSEAPKQEAKSEYSDEEVLKFMKDYIDVQAQATGTFDLYDEKKQKMRNLELVSLDQKVRRYGVIAISTAEFTDKNSGETVMVDVNAENRNGLGITAMRLKSVKKAPAPSAQPEGK